MRKILTAVLVLLPALPAAAQDLRSAFYALPRAERMELQERLAAPGLYRGDIDGLWGPGTASAFAAAQDSLAWPAFRELAEDGGAASEAEALWAYVADPALPASLPAWRN